MNYKIITKVNIFNSVNALLYKCKQYITIPCPLLCLTVHERQWLQKYIDNSKFSWTLQTDVFPYFFNCKNYTNVLFLLFSEYCPWLPYIILNVLYRCSHKMLRSNFHLHVHVYVSQKYAIHWNTHKKKKIKIINVQTL